LARVLLLLFSARHFVVAYLILRTRRAPSSVLSGSGQRAPLVKQKPTILCIDDKPDWLSCLKVLLREEYEVLIANSESEGLKLHASQPVDAVILDCQMPEVTGDRIAAQMKRTNPDVPIVLLSGHHRLPEDVLQSVDAFVAKGESPANLLTTVHDLLGARSPFFTRWFNNWRHQQALKGSKPSQEATR
jgi:response regulator RpfG family c-di-GMP phosphodiesterase